MHSYQQSLNYLISSSQESIETYRVEIDESRAEASRILEAMRSAAAEQGVTQESRTFQKAREHYELLARRWLVAVILAAVVTAGSALAIVFGWTTEGTISDGTVLQIVLAKAAVLAILTYVTVSAGRIYRSNTHLASVNRHREDALRTFQAFVEGTENDEIKDKVLLAAAHAAFGHTATGLIGERSEGSSAIEILDGIGGSLIRKS